MRFWDSSAIRPAATPAYPAESVEFSTDMALSIDQDAPVILMATDDPEALVAGALLRQEDSTLWVRVDEATKTLQVGQLVLALMQSSNAPLYAHAQVAAIEVDAVAVVLLAPFRAAANRRGEPRYPSLLAAIVHRDNGELVPARVLDISRGGAAIELPSRDGDSGFELRLPLEGRTLALRCHVAGAEDAWNTTILHCSFVRTTPPQHAALDDLIRDLRRSFTRAQTFLASRIDDPPRLRSGATA